jgi:hypothetical protein
MRLQSKIRLATGLCVACFSASVLVVFMCPQYTQLVTVLGVCSGYLATKWKRQAGIGGGSVIGDRINHLTKWWLTIATLPFYVLLTAGLFWIGGSRLYLLHLYTVDSIRTDGRIVNRFKTGGGYKNPIIYHITYTYSTRDGATYQNQEEVDYRTYGTLASAAAIPVKYLPWQQSRSRVDFLNDDQIEGGSAFFVVVLGIVLFIWGIWAYWFYLKKFSQIGSGPVSP